MSLLNSSRSRNLMFYFQVHQPARLRPMRFFDIGSQSTFLNDDLNKDVISRVAKTCYLPTNALLHDLIRKNPEIKVTFSISGIAFEQFRQFAPEVLESFQALAATGSVEFLAETYYHSLACMMPGHEFEIQVLKHAELIENLFGKRPTVFRNTELIYNDEIGRRIAALGFRGVLTDGVSQILGRDRTATQVYHHPEDEAFRILLRNYLLSDDIAFRFGQHGNPLTAETYITWLNDIPTSEPVVNIGMDYETFGEHHRKETGIHKFLKKLFSTLGKSAAHKFLTAGEAASLPAASTLSVQDHVSWADRERDLSAWLGNDMQRDAFATLTKLEKNVKVLGIPEILRQWRSLQTSDHFYYMSTKKGTDGAIHNYFSPFPSPYEAFINYMNVLTDLTVQVNSKKSLVKKPTPGRIARTSPLEKVAV